MRYFLVIILGFFGLSISAQTFTISGKIQDAESGELMSNVSVWDSLSGAATLSNAYGFFSLTLSKTSGKIRFSYVGYETYYLSPVSDDPITIRLKKAGDLEEIIVKNRTSAPGNPNLIPISEIRNMPSLLGEADVLKAFSFLPGISTGGEGSAGLYVRGGSPDENLILLDDVPVYNAMHLGGFFSVFNPASLKNAEIYKGSFPARFGGRLSSVIDLNMKEGNNQKFGGEVSLGLLNQSVLLEGPIIRDKASFIVSGRVSTLGLSTLLRKPRRKQSSGEDYIYKFHDFNAKLNYQINKTDHLFLSFYNGFDRFTYDDWVKTTSNEEYTTVGNNWGNSTGTIRYSKMISPKLFLRGTLIYSDYTSEFTNDFGDNNSSFYRYSDTRITDLGAKFQLDYFPNRFWEVKTGAEFTHHLFKPFDMKSNFSEQTVEALNNVNTKEANVFMDNDIKITRNLNLNAGLRYSTYLVRRNSFNKPEPRLSFNWRFLDNWTLSGGYTVMHQFVHLLTNNGYGFGYDAWLPATDKIPPSRATQWSVGLSKKIPKAGLEWSFELYQKKVGNRIDYPDGTNFTGMLADSWENIVQSGGMGRSKGIESMLAKNTSKLKGQISYTLSKSELKFEDINQGKWYPMKYDRRHQFNFTASYNINRKWSLNSTFTYQTGHAVSLPVAAYTEEPKYIFNERNNARMPDFHKLDLGISRKGKIWGKYETRLSLGLYNAYNRANPLYIDFKTQYNQETGQKSLIVKQYSLFPILPFINYTIIF